MTASLKRLDDTCNALVSALGARDWNAIAKLDVGCRSCIDEVLGENALDEALVRQKLEGLLAIYRDLVEATVSERQTIANQMTQINQAKNASKVYHLFS